MDFVHDALGDGRPFRALTVVDPWSRQSPILEAAASMSGHTVSVALDRPIAAGAVPRSISFGAGNPSENAFVESFNGRLRDECLNVHQFTSIADAQAKVDAWEDGC
jgi:putative transposase